MGGALLERVARFRLFGRSPLGAWLRVNESIWAHISPWAPVLHPVESYGRFLHSLVLARADRHMYLGTFFFRNRAELHLIARLSRLREKASRPVRIAVVGCSDGAEVYSIVYSLCAADAAPSFLCQGVDISADAVAAARAGVYSRAVSGLTLEPALARMTPAEMKGMFDGDGDHVRVKARFRENVAWHVGDAADPQLARLLGPQDIVVANRFLCHLPPTFAEQCLRAVARLVAPGGYLFVSGVDLDVRTRVARALGWKPVCDSIEEVHEGDVSLRSSWPLKYWGLEPIDKSRADWSLRYASAFQLP